MVDDNDTFRVNGKKIYSAGYNSANEVPPSTGSLLFSRPYYTERYAYVTTDDYLPLVQKIAAAP